MSKRQERAPCATSSIPRENERLSLRRPLKMLHFLLRRLLLTIPVLLGVATLVFSLIHLVPGDPVQTMLGESAAPQEIVRVRTQLGLDRPLYIQYWAFLRGVGKGDLGVSLRTNEPVAQAIADRMPATIELAIAAMCLA